MRQLSTDDKAFLGMLGCITLAGVVPVTIVVGLIIFAIIRFS